MFKYLGFTEEEAKAQFGFLMDAFQFGAPPHGGLAFGLDRLVAILGGQETIRDFIAFPKNNSGRDVMIDAPSKIDDVQLKELHINLVLFVVYRLNLVENVEYQYFYKIKTQVGISYCIKYYICVIINYYYYYNAYRYS